MHTGHLFQVRGMRGEACVPGEQGGQGESEEEVKRKARAKEAAAARRAKILAQMNKAQKTFAAENSAALAGMGGEAVAELGRQESVASSSVCLGPGQTARSQAARTYTCILCQV